VPRPTICLVTGDHGIEAPLLELIAAAVDAGVDLIQIRERRMNARTLLTTTTRAVALTRGTASRIVVNDRADVALAAGAAGVHLRGNSFDATRLRAVAPAGFLISRSVHNRQEAAAAEAERCDYVLFGTVFRSSSKPEHHPVAGVDALRDLAGSVHLPVLAIGGVSLANVMQVAQAGASGVAAIGLFENRTSLATIVAQLRRRFDT
jgi:thiamine-phosphate pyrophosphorylase